MSVHWAGRGPGHLSRQPTSGFTPWSLGASLLGYWDAETASTLTLSGSNVTTWTDLVGAYAPTQSVGGSKPVYSTTGFAGRPGVTFDGTDDELTLASQPFPAAATPSEIWALFLNNGDIAMADTRTVFSYGGALAVARRLDLVPGTIAGQNKAQLTVGTGGGSVSVQSGNIASATAHVARLAYGATQSSIYTDGGSATTSAAVPATGTDRFRIGATAGGSPLQFFNGTISAIIVTGALSADQAAALTTYLKARGGIA